MADLMIIEPTELESSVVVEYLTSISDGSRPTMKGALIETVSILTGVEPERVNIYEFNWSNVKAVHVALVKEKMWKNGNAAGTVNKKLAAIRGVMGMLFERGAVKAEDYLRITRVKNIKGSALPAGRRLGVDEIKALVGACEADKTVFGVRDAAIIAVLRKTGLRREEVASLDLSSCVSGYLRFVGKGNKEREVPLSGQAREAIENWLKVRGSGVGALFCGVNGYGEVKTEKHLALRSINVILAKRAAEAGIKDFTPHDFRRTFATDLLDSGTDIGIVKGLMGHSDVQTTLRYDHRDDKGKREAVEFLDKLDGGNHGH